MDAKITLSFNKAVIEKAKRYSDKNNISVSRLVEFLLNKVTSGHYISLEDYPIADWVNQLAEGNAIYQKEGKTRKKLRNEFFNSKK